MIKVNLKKYLIVKWRKPITSNLVVIIFFSSINILYSQEIKSVKNIIGNAFISGDISPNQARAQALNDAKINALKSAGIAENINAYQLLLTSQNNNDYRQFFASDIQSEMQGAVQSYSIKSEKNYCKNDKELICEVVIDAEVIKYNTKPDINFDVNIIGIKGAYNNNEKLTFTINSTEACYLTIFNLADKESTLLFPNEYEQHFLINSNQKINFPVAKIDYLMNTEVKPQETNRLIFVFTKTKIPFIKIGEGQLAKQDDIFKWIYSIPPDQRKIQYFQAIITN